MWRTLNETLSSFCSSAFLDQDSLIFTSCFEATVLIWFPCAFLWIFTPLEIYYLRRSRGGGATHILTDFYNASKLITIGLVGVTAFGDAIAHFFIHIIPNSEHSYTLIIKCFTLCLFFGLTYANIKYGVRSSGILFIFSFFLAFCGVPQFLHSCASTIKDLDQAVSSVNSMLFFIYYLLVLIIFVLNCFVGNHPDEQNQWKEKNISPESISSFLSRISFTWIGELVWKNYRNPLKDNDLWNLDHEMRTTSNVATFESKLYRAERRHQKVATDANRYENEILLENKTNGGNAKIYCSEIRNERRTEIGLLLPLFKTFGSSFVFAMIVLLCFTSLNFANPQILNSILEFASSKNDEYAWRGFFYAFLFLLVGALQTVLINVGFDVLFKIGFRARTALASIIYKKALKVSTATKKDFSYGEIVNLIVVDAPRFDKLAMYIAFVCVYLTDVLVSFCFLWNILGPCVIAGVAVLIILMVIVGIVVSKLVIRLQTKQMKYKDKRVKLTNEIVSGIKVLKLYACEPTFEKYVTEIRDKEVKILKWTAFLHAVSSFAWICSPFLVSFVTFGAYVLSDEKNVLNPQIAFVSVSLFNIMKVAMKRLPFALHEIVLGCVSAKRITKFLNSEELDSNAVLHEQRTESIVMEDGEFSWDGYEGAPILSNINLIVNPGDLVAVVGPVGSGKSSLLYAILGEMYKKSGYVNTIGRLAYVPQQAWIQNATLRDNITLGEEVRSSFYDSTLKACALIPDLKTLPAGDRTKVGEKGINLSGGQKQRISLARAVYSGADTYLLDDPLSAVDVHVGKHIFEKVIGPKGLLKKKNRTISEAGTYNELLSRGGGLASLVVSYANENAENTTDITEDEIHSQEDIVEENRPKQIRKRSASAEEKPDEGPAQVEPEETPTEHNKWNVCVYYLQAVGLFMVSVTLISNLLYQAFSVSTDYWLSAWSSRRPTNSSSTTSDQFEYLAVYALLGLGQAVNVVTQTVAVYIGMLRASRSIHNRLLTSVLRWPAVVFDKIPSGRIINRLGSDVDVLDSTLPSNVLQFLLHASLVLSNLSVITYNTPLFICIFLPIILLYSFLQKVYQGTSTQLRHLESASRSPIYSHFGDSIAGLESIRAHYLQTKFIQTLDTRIDSNLKSAYSGMVVDRWFGVRSSLLGSTTVFCVALLSILGRSVIGTALVGLLITYALQITDNLYWLIQSGSAVLTNMVAVERTREYSEMEQEAAWIVPNATVPEGWPTKGEITFEDFRVRYHESLEPVLKGINFHVNSGEKVGIIGRTGAGKTSLTLSLFRLIESAGGSIHIDDVDIAKIGLHTLRGRLTIIPQDPVLFSGTLRMNLDLTNTYSDDHLWKTLELINLKSYMPCLDHGLHSIVEEGGSNFSIGQRQLICLARALLRKTKVLVLDEATAAIDFETDDLIQSIIRREFSDCTVLTIAHRLNTIIDYERIMVLDAGRIAEFSSPEALLGLKNSIFYSMAVNAGLV